MSTSYYSLPLKFNKLLEKEDHKKSTLKQSISSFLHLLLSTYMGECDFDDSFGNTIWDLDFDTIESTNTLCVNVATSLKETIEVYEKRLKKVLVEVKMHQTDTFDKTKKQHNIKKQLNIHITGTIKQTNESYAYIETFFIAPLSY